jgi:hypothetical protein
MENNELPFSEWLEKTMKEQGRKYTWLANKLDSISYYTILYKVKTNSFNYEEEKNIKKIFE